MKVYVINLKRDILKRERAVSILEENGLDYEFVDAVFGADLEDSYLSSIDYKSKNLLQRRGFTMRTGEIGLYLSHLKAWQLHLSSSDRYVCVLEDDFILSSLLSDFLKAIDNSKVDLGFDLLMLGHFLKRKDRGVLSSFFDRRMLSGIAISTPLEFNYGTHAYVISREASFFLTRKYNEPTRPIDHIMGGIEVLGLRRKVVNPVLVYQSDVFESSIQATDFVNENKLIFYLKRFCKFFLFNLFYSLAVNRIKKYLIN